jgi:hypothetical protein
MAQPADLAVRQSAVLLQQLPAECRDAQDGADDSADPALGRDVRHRAPDTGTPVGDQDYQVPFAFTGKIDKLTFVIERPVGSEADKQKLEAAYRAAQDAN